MPELMELDGLLSKVVESVLETMFFTETLGAAEENESDDLSRLAAHLAFHGSPSGDLAVCISAAAIRPLAAGFLGEDEADVSDRQTGEMVCELANMLCGAAVSYLETKKSFDLTTPRLVTLEQALAPRSEAGTTSRRSFALEQGTLTVVLHLGAE